MLTKTKFVEFMKCNNISWLEENYKAILNDDNKNTSDGILVGNLARNIFGDYVLIDSSKYDQNELVRETKKHIEDLTNVICEATFKYKDLLCKVDILKRNEDNTYNIYEVKASTYTGKLDKNYLLDIAYQKYVVTNSLVDVKDTYLVLLNPKYIKKGELELNKLFKIINVNEYLTSIKVDKYIYEYFKYIKEPDEPKIEVGSKCNDCKYNEYCFEKLNIKNDKNSILKLYNCRKKYDYINEGILTFEDIYNTKYFDDLNEFNQRIIDFYINKKDIYYDKNRIKEFLSNIKFPIYFFDFETYQMPIPEFDNSKPYQQIPFQYSLHIMDSDYNLIHKEFLGDGITDPRLALKNQMIKDLGDSGTIIAYNHSFEKTRIKELMDIFPEDRLVLEKINERFIDLADPFQKCMYYNHLMRRTSIKDVLPSIFPTDPTLDYHNLENVHKGDEASNAYLNLKNLDEENKAIIRNSLLKYCCLDTYAMVKIYLYLLDIVK